MDVHGVERKQVVSASKKLTRGDAAELAKLSAKVIVAKGKAVQAFAGGKGGTEVVDAMLGPTGNLRAPALRIGKTLLVGFHEETYRDHLL